MSKLLVKNLQIMLSKEEYDYLEELRKKAHIFSRSSFGRQIVLTFIERTKAFNNDKKNK